VEILSQTVELEVFCDFSTNSYLSSVLNSMIPDPLTIAGACCSQSLALSGFFHLNVEMIDETERDFPSIRR
jgi:hypothetical protein